jgi:hypothetical protein
MLTRTANVQSCALASPERFSSSAAPVVVHCTGFLTFFFFFFDLLFFFFVKTRAGQWVVVVITDDTSVVKHTKSTHPIVAATIRSIICWLWFWYWGILTRGLQQRRCPFGLTSSTANV